ncbi:hypothetical protein LCGC14_2098470 [marine sediment metagenome]|uniref:Uncharacterized protein n=1 Tax=marine sediment metagenome TaxID=412755 RepID=A0A0F9GNT6_9ZZZZ
MEEIREILSQVARGNNNAITIAKEMKDGVNTITVNMKQERVMPERMESPPRAHIFHTAEGFIEYIKAEKTEHTLVLADINRACVHAILNDRATHGFEGVCLEPALDPRFALLTKTLLHGGPIPIAEFALAVMRNRNVMAGTPAKAQQLAILMQQITVSSQITACSADLGIGLNGVLCKTSVKAGEGETQVNIPSSIAVKLPIYLNTPEVEFDLDITLSAARSGEVIVSVDAPELDLRKYAQSISDILRYSQLEKLPIFEQNIRPLACNCL